jgi:hypothetical protein
MGKIQNLELTIYLRKFGVHYIQRFSSYRAVNKLDTGYKNISVNAVQGNNRRLLRREG